MWNLVQVIIANPEACFHCFSLLTQENVDQKVAEVATDIITETIYLFKTMENGSPNPVLGI